MYQANPDAFRETENNTWLGNSLKQGSLQGEIANVLPVGRQPTPEELEKLAGLNYQSQRIPQSDAQRRYEVDGLGVFKDPLLGSQFLTETIASSMASLYESAKRTVPAGAAIGAGAGALFGGIGAFPGAGIGVMSGLSVAGLNLSTSGSIMKSLTDSGIDITDKDALIKAFSNEHKMSEARTKALKYGVPIMAFDVATAGIAGKLVGGAVGKSLARKMIAGVGEVGIQAVGGAGGELAGQVVSGQDVDWNEVAIEGIASIATDAPDIAIGAISRSKSSSSNKNIVTQIVNQGVENGSKDAQINLDRDLANGVITPEEHQEGLDHIENVKVTNEKIPDSVQGENREASIDILTQKQKLVTEIEALKEEKKKTDDAYHKPIDEKIERREARIEMLNKTIQELAKKPKEGVEPVIDETVIEPTQEQPVVNPQEIDQTLITEQDAIQEQEPSSVLQYPQEGVGETGSGRTGVESVEQGNGLTTESISKEVPTRKEEVTNEQETKTEGKDKRPVTATGSDTAVQEEVAPEFANEGEAIRYQVENTTDPDEVAAIYHNNPQEPDYKTDGIMDFVGKRGKINEKDWRSYGDVNAMTPEMRRRFIDSTNKSTPLDDQAMQVSDLLGVPVEAQDFIDAVTLFNNQGEYAESKKSPIQRQAEQKYKELTGKNLTTKRAEASYFKIKNKPKSNEELYESNKQLQEIGITYEDIENYNDYTKQEPDGTQEANRAKDNDTGASRQVRGEGEKVQSKLDSAKEKLAEKREALNKLNINPGIANDPKRKAKALFEYHGALVDVAKEYIKEGITDVKEFAKGIGEKVTKSVQDAWNEAMGGAKKTEKDFEVTEEVEESDSRGKRMTTQRVLSGQYRQAFKDAIGDNAIYYKELPNDLTSAEAQAIIDIKGLGESESLIFDMNNNISLPVRFTIAQKLIDNYEKSGELLKSVDIFERIVEKITDTAQGLQSLSAWPKLSKASEVAGAKRNIERQRNKFRERTKKTTNKIDKEFKKINKETAEEVVKTVKKAIEANTRVKPEGTISDLPLGYGTKNKVFTRDRYLKAKQRLRGMALSGIPAADLIDIAGYHIEATGRDFARFSRRMKADLGGKIKPFLKDIYGQTRESLITEGYDKSLFLTDAELDAQINENEGQVWKEKLDRAIQKKDDKAQKVAIKRLQEISKDEGVWGQYKDSAAKKLKGMVLTNAEKDISANPSLQQFTDGLVKNMRQKMAELLPEQSKKKVVPRPDIEIIGDAYKNVDAYREVWDRTQAEFQEKYADQPEVLEAIDEYFGEILDKPFSDRLINRAVSVGLSQMDKSIGDLVIQHYTVLDNAKQSLADKLVNDAGLTGVEAAALAKAVEKEFDRIATKKKQDILQKMFSKQERKKPAIRSLEGDLIKMSNLGAFRTNDIIEIYGDKMGWAKLTEANIKEIERLSDAAQKAEDPIKKRRAVEDLLAYQAKIKGHSISDLITAIWYANVLSGYNTQIVNFGANAINTLMLYGGAISRRPKDAIFIGKGLIEGTKRGWLEANETLRTGYSPIKGKAEVPQLLERLPFKGKMFNYLNALKYVRRVMVAADVIFFEGQKEMRAYQLASIQSSKEGKLEPTVNQRNLAIELVGKSDGQVEAIKEQVELEYENEVNSINESDVSQEEKVKMLTQAKRDKPRRIFDLIEQERSGDMIQETAEYAAQGTYNYPPKGALGAVAWGLNKMVESLPIVRYSVPFTNIIANVANTTIDYSPLGFARRYRADSGGGIISQFRREPLTDQQKIDLTTKAFIGTASMAIAFALTQIKGDDDEPFLEITSNGTGDYAKNATLKETGWQEYSIRVKLPSGEYSDWYSYQYSPLILSLGFIGHINDLQKYKEEKDDDTIYALMSKAAGLSVATLFQATFLDGFGDMLSTLLDPRSSGGTIDKAMQGALGAVKGVVLPNLASQSLQAYQRLFGDYKKETRETLMGKVLQDIPYARDKYYNKINILGDPISPDTDKFHSADIPNKIIQLLIDKKAVFAPINRKTEKIYDMELERERILTDEEFHDYSEYKGQFIKRELTDNYKELNSLEIGKFKKELTRIKTEATKQARRNMGELPPEIVNIEINNEDYVLNKEQILERTTLIDDFKRRKEGSILQRQIRKGKTEKEAESILESQARSDATEKFKKLYKNGEGLEKK